MGCSNIIMIDKKHGELAQCNPLKENAFIEIPMIYESVGWRRADDMPSNVKLTGRGPEGSE